MTFPWLDRTAPGTSSSASSPGSGRLSAAQRELRERSAMLARLGMSPEDATARLCARIAWEFEPCSSVAGPHARPAELTDDAIGAIVREVYASKRF